MADRRRHKRKSTSTRTMLKSRWQLADALCLDASMGGFLLHAHHEFSVGDDVEIALEVPGGKRLNCEGEVVRLDVKHPAIKKGEGYGVRITKIDPETRAELGAWIGKLTEEPAAARAADAKRPAATKPGVAAAAGTGSASGTGVPAGKGATLKLQRILMRLRKIGGKK